LFDPVFTWLFTSYVIFPHPVLFSFLFNLVFLFAISSFPLSRLPPRHQATFICLFFFDDLYFVLLPTLPHGGGFPPLWLSGPSSSSVSLQLSGSSPSPFSPLYVSQLTPDTGDRSGDSYSIFPPPGDDCSELDTSFPYFVNHFFISGKKKSFFCSL